MKAGRARASIGAGECDRSARPSIYYFIAASWGGLKRGSNSTPRCYRAASVSFWGSNIRIPGSHIRGSCIRVVAVLFFNCQKKRRKGKKSHTFRTKNHIMNSSEKKNVFYLYIFISYYHLPSYIPSVHVFIAIIILLSDSAVVLQSSHPFSYKSWVLYALSCLFCSFFPPS